MVVDEKGDFIQPDYLIPIFAESCIDRLEASEKLGNTVIHDVRTSRAVQEAIVEMGQKPVMGKVGHAFAKVLLRESGAVCGGELAGHYYFREFFGCDSGVLAALRILQCVAKAASEGRRASEMVAKVNSRYANSGELNFRVDDKDAAIARVLDAASRELPPELSRTGIDGVRVEYAEGWINIRKSNTEPYLRLIAEADTKERLGAWVSVLTRAVEERRGT
jgi:phosphomannomutase